MNRFKRHADGVTWRHTILALASFLWIGVAAFPAFALRPAGLGESNPMVRKELIEALKISSGLEENSSSGPGEQKASVGAQGGTGVQMNRRSFFKLGGLQVAGGAVSFPDPKLLEKALSVEQQSLVGRLIQLYANWPSQGFSWDEKQDRSPEGFAQLQSGIKEITDSLGPDHPVTKLIGQSEAGFRQAIASLLSGTTPDSETHPGAQLRGEALLMRVDRFEDYPLWLLTRTLPQVLKAKFGVEGISPEGEFAKAEGSRLTAEQYLEELLDRYVMSSPLVQQTVQRWQRLGVSGDLRYWMRIFLEENHRSILGRDLDASPTFRLEADHWVRMTERALIEKAWSPIREAVETRIRSRFGGDATFGKEVWPADGPDELSLEEAAARYEAASVDVSLKNRKLTLKAQAMKSIRRQRSQGAVIPVEKEQAELERIERLSPEGLEAMRQEELLGQFERQFPAPDPSKLLARGQLPTPMPLVEALAEILSRAARVGPVVLWIRTDREARLDAVRWEMEKPLRAEGSKPAVVADLPYRAFSLSKEELKALEDQVAGLGYRRGNVRYRLEIPAGTRSAALASFLRLSTWWGYSPDPSKRRIVQVSWPIALPDLKGGLASGLEERQQASRELGRSI